MNLAYIDVRLGGGGVKICLRNISVAPIDEEGRASVKKSGLYYIYAQVNYLGIIHKLRRL